MVCCLTKLLSHCYCFIPRAGQCPSCVRSGCFRTLSPVSKNTLDLRLVPPTSLVLPPNSADPVEGTAELSSTLNAMLVQSALRKPSALWAVRAATALTQYEMGPDQSLSNDSRTSIDLYCPLLEHWEQPRHHHSDLFLRGCRRHGHRSSSRGK